MQTKMVDVSLLSHAEIDWLNSYHAEVWEKVSPHMALLCTYSISCLKPVDVSLAGFTFVRRSYSAMALEQHSSLSQTIIKPNQSDIPTCKLSRLDPLGFYNHNLLLSFDGAV